MGKAKTLEMFTCSKKKNNGQFIDAVWVKAFLAILCCTVWSSAVVGPGLMNT